MSLAFDLPYFPRNGLLEEVLKVYESGFKQGVTLFAPRRQGKTSFVKHELVPAARELGWQTIYVDLWKRRGEPELALVEALEATVEQRQSGLRRKLKLKQVKAKAKGPGGEVESTMEPISHSPEGVLENRLDAALTALVGNRRTLLILDEVQALAGAKRDDFVAALRTVIQKLQGHLVVFYTGSSRDGLNSMFRLQKAPLFASAMPVHLPDLGDDFIEDRLVFLAERSQAQVNKEALERVFDDLGKTPEFLNEVILHLIIANDGNIDRAMEAWQEAHREAGAGSVLSDLRPIELAVMELLAQRDHPTVYSAEALSFVQNAVGKSEVVAAAKIQSAIKKLAKLDLVAATGRKSGDYEIDDRAVLLQLRKRWTTNG
ncbi:AAA+ ATPase superfamily predicted ATPase [Luteibacter rhizovicinus]|uniref:AAA+ ATPase superfamily predicted ATPase n=1 Tax=Luteibacter rhizovicinus TaxID=242606 RepID=A0A4V2W4M2_9GAMM|nr:ATP-binding protein [Luteibacter rhizovicinus]TCV96439.1 AAA+ ATPase superfamily predicted ATPase [Luteibacter rhizovicinus]